ncbi:MAG: CHAT domain-containing protein [Acidobacteriota bacterium]
MSSADDFDIPPALAALTRDSERHDYFARHSELVQGEVVAALTREVSRLFGVDLEKARDLAATAQWIAEALHDNASLARATRAAANVAHSLGETERAQDLYQAALAGFEALGEDGEAAVTRSSALLNLAFLGRHSQVETWYEAARQVFRQLDDRRRLATLQHNFGIILGRQDRWEEALDCYTSARQEFQRLDKVQDFAICLRNIAVCHINLHDFTAALDSYEENRAFCRQHGLTRILLQVEYNIAYLYYLRGEYTRAIRLFQAARRACEDAGDDYHTALCDLDQAEIYLDLNLAKEAASLAQAAFDTFDRLKIPYESAKALTFRAIALSRLGRAQEALHLLRRARQIFVSERNRLWPALIDFYQAVVLARDARPQAAVRLARSARRTFQTLHLDPRVAMCEVQLAELRLSLGEPDRARRSCQGAISRLAELDLPALEHRAYLALGQIEEAIGDRQAALAAYQRSHQRLEQLRSQLQGDDLKIAFLKDKHVVYESLVWLTLDDDEAGAHQARAFTYIEAAKSRSLVDLMAFRAHALAPTTAEHAELAERVQGLREELNWLYRQIDTDQRPISDRSRQRRGALRLRTRNKEEELLTALRSLRTTDREFTSLQSGSVIDFETIRSSLPAEATLIEYFIARDRIFACVIDRQTMAVVPLTSATNARKHHRFLQFQLARSGQSGATGTAPRGIEEATSFHLGELYSDLIAPIRGYLRGRHLVIVPHGFLHYVPFHALHDGDTYLVDRFTVSYAPSAEVFHLCTIKQARCEEMSLVLGVADERAPHILAEAQAVAKALPQPTLLLGDDASLGALRRQGSRSRFLHIATHGIFRRDNPMFSAIQLGTRRLSLFDLYDLRLAAELVVLSGCGTGLGTVFGGEELVGLTRGLLYAGARSALVTLWDVHDASTADFMGLFYRHLTAGSERAEALRQAMRDLRQEYPSPYYWAPFVLVGKPAS